VTTSGQAPHGQHTETVSGLSPPPAGAWQREGGETVAPPPPGPCDTSHVTAYSPSPQRSLHVWGIVSGPDDDSHDADPPPGSAGQLVKSGLRHTSEQPWTFWHRTRARLTKHPPARPPSLVR
jgi:hypothetical protein